MENSIEEDIKILENFINWLKTDFEYNSGEEIKAIEHILSDYKRVLKENEELKSKEMKEFINEVINLMKKYNLSISHEDTHGAFIIEKYHDYNIKWFKDAMKNY